MSASLHSPGRHVERADDPKRVECSASVYGLLVALGVAPFALSPLAPAGRPLLDHCCNVSACPKAAK